MNTTYYIEALKQKLELSIAPQKASIRSTEFLSGVIFGSIQENISSTTLQRFFGIVDLKYQKEAWILFVTFWVMKTGIHFVPMKK